MPRPRPLPTLPVLACLGLLVWLLAEDRRASGPLDTSAEAPDHRDAQMLEVEPRLRPAAQPQSGREQETGFEAGAGAEEHGDCAITLRVEAVDALTGRAVPATWNLGTGAVVVAPSLPGVVVDETARQRQRRAVEASIARWKAGFVASGQALPAHLCVGQDKGNRITVRPPPGYVVLDEDLQFDCHLAVGVREARRVVPLWPEAVLDLRILDEWGRPVDEPSLLRLTIHDWEVPVRAEVLGPGELRVHGIPCMPAERVLAWLTWGWSKEDRPQAGSEDVEEVVEADVFVPKLETTIPADRSAPWRVELRVEGERGPRDLGLETDNDLPYEASIGLSDAPPDSRRTGTARVRVLGWDGSPAVGMGILDEETDARGELLLEAVQPGKRVIVASGPGRFDACAVADVVAEGRTDLTLREPKGARLDVVVTDAEGRPRPSARIEISPGRVFDVAGGIQRIDMRTDHVGRRTFTRVEPGPCALRAYWGGHTGTAGQTLLDGRTYAVTIVVR